MPTLTTLVDDTIPVAADFNNNYSLLNQAIGTSTTITTYTTGDILYASAANTLSKLAAGSAGQVLAQGASVPQWGLTAVAGTPIAHGLYRENVAKGWLYANMDGTVADSFNVASITDTGTGDVTITWDRDFATANYAVVATASHTGAAAAASTLTTHVLDSSTAVGACEVISRRVSDGVATDPVHMCAHAFGDHA